MTDFTYLDQRDDAVSSTKPTSAREWRQALRSSVDHSLTDEDAREMRLYGYSLPFAKMKAIYNHDDLTRITLIDYEKRDSQSLDDLFMLNRSVTEKLLPRPLIEPSHKIDPASSNETDSSDSSNLVGAPDHTAPNEITVEDEDHAGATDGKTHADAVDDASINGDNMIKVRHARIVPGDPIQVARNRAHALDRFDLTCGAPVIGDLPLITYLPIDLPVDNDDISGKSPKINDDLNETPSNGKEVTDDGPSSNDATVKTKTSNEDLSSDDRVRIRWRVTEAVTRKNAPKRSMPGWCEVMAAGWWTLATSHWTSPFVMVDVDSADALDRYDDAVSDGMPAASYVILNQANGHAQFFWIIPSVSKINDHDDTRSLYKLVTAGLNWRLGGDRNAHGLRCRNPFYAGCNSNDWLGYESDGTIHSTGDQESNKTPKTRDVLTDDDPVMSVFYPDSGIDGGVHVWTLTELYYELSALEWIPEARKAMRVDKIKSRGSGAGAVDDGSWTALDPSHLEGPVPKGLRHVTAFRVATWAVWHDAVQPEAEAMLQFVRDHVTFEDADSFGDKELKEICVSVLNFYKKHYDPNHLSRKTPKKQVSANADVAKNGDLDRDSIIKTWLKAYDLKLEDNNVIDLEANRVVCSQDDLVIDGKTGRLLDPRARAVGSRGGRRNSLAQRMAREENLRKGRERRRGDDGLTDNERIVAQVIAKVRSDDVDGEKLTLDDVRAVNHELKTIESRMDETGKDWGDDPEFFMRGPIDGDDTKTNAGRVSLDSNDQGDGVLPGDIDVKTVGGYDAADLINLIGEPVKDEAQKCLAVLEESYPGTMSKATFYRSYRRLLDHKRWWLVRYTWRVIRKSYRPWERGEWTPESDHWSRPLFWMGKIAIATALQLAPALGDAGYVRSALACVDAMTSVVRFVDRKMENKSLWPLRPVLEAVKHVFIDNGLARLVRPENADEIFLPVTLDQDDDAKAKGWLDYDKRAKIDPTDLGSMGVLADYLEWASTVIRMIMGRVWIEDTPFDGRQLKGAHGVMGVLEMLKDMRLDMSAVNRASTGDGLKPDRIGMLLATSW